MNLIGISGKKKSGKDTAATLLKSLHDFKTVRIYHFADALKQEISIMYGVPVSFIEAHKENFRLILQGHGTDYRRKLYSHDYWIKKMEQAVESFDKSGVKTLIIPDVRFFNEAEFIRKHHGTVVRITRMYDDTTDRHPSETELDDYKFDYVIQNDGTLGDLLRKIQEFKI